MILPAHLVATGPFFVPDETPIETRVSMLVDMARFARKSPEIQGLVAEVLRRTPPSATRQYRVLLTNALNVVRERVPYVRYPNDAEQWFRPVAQAVRLGGMCGELAAILSAVLCELGVPNLIQWITQEGQAANHLTLLGFDGTDWAYADPTIPGAQVGETPYEALLRSLAYDRVGGKPVSRR